MNDNHIIYLLISLFKTSDGLISLRREVYGSLCHVSIEKGVVVSNIFVGTEFYHQNVEFKNKEIRKI